MKIITTLVLALMSAPAISQELCDILNGASIIAQDSKKTFLGKISSSYDSKSIFNEYGEHGSEYSSKSIWNEYSEFGNEFNGYSPFNEFSSSPPMIIRSGRVIGHLSTNKFVRASVAPNLLKAVCKDAL